MLKPEQITKISQLLKIKEDDLKNALANESEVEVTIPEISTFTTEELTARDTNIKGISYKEGKGAAVEMLVKEQKEKLGLEFEGKDPEKLIEAIQTKALADAKIEPNKKIEELNGVIKNLQTSVSEFKTKEENLLKEIETSKLDSQLLGMLPKDRQSVLTDNEYLSMLKSQYSFEVEEGKMVAKKGNEVLRDKTTQNPIEAKEVISGYFTERKWIAEGGRQGRAGGGDGKCGSIYLGLSELKTEWESQGKSTNGIEFQKAVEAARQANPNFDMGA